MKQLAIDIQCRTTSKYALEVSLIINDVCVYNSVGFDHVIPVTLDYDATVIQDHKFQLKLDGKRTLIDSHDDTETCLEINQICFDGIDVVKAIQGSYTHDSNGYGEQTIDKFSQVLGCDGIVEFSFHTPLSYWLSAKYPF